MKRFLWLLLFFCLLPIPSHAMGERVAGLEEKREKIRSNPHIPEEKKAYIEKKLQQKELQQKEQPDATGEATRKAPDREEGLQKKRDAIEQNPHIPEEKKERLLEKVDSLREEEKSTPESSKPLSPSEESPAPPETSRPDSNDENLASPEENPRVVSRKKISTDANSENSMRKILLQRSPYRLSFEEDFVLESLSARELLLRRTLSLSTRYFPEGGVLSREFLESDPYLPRSKKLLLLGESV